MLRVIGLLRCGPWPLERLANARKKARTAMQKFEIRPGEEYLLRETRKPDAPVQRVKVLEHVRAKKWKAEWIEPNPGLIEYVESQNLIVRWKDRKSFLRDED